MRSVLRRYRAELKMAGLPVTRLYLFGSQVKGTAHLGSDIDVAVVSPRFGRDYVRESIFINRIADRVDSLIEAHPLHPREFTDPWSTFAQEIRQYGKAV